MKKQSDKNESVPRDCTGTTVISGDTHHNSFSPCFRKWTPRVSEKM